MNPPDKHDNVYQPPSSAFVTAEKVEEAQTSNGSYIKVGQRKRFTGAFSLIMIFVLGIVMFVQIGVCVGGGAYVAATISPLLGSLMMIAGPVLGYALLLPWYSGIAFADILMKSKDFREETNFVVGIRFTPRLTVKAPEKLDADDDTGVISPVPGFLLYQGDRIEMRISRQDVSSIRKERASLWKLGMVGPDLVVEFAQPVLHCYRMRLVTNEGWTTWKSAHRAKDLARAIEEWFGQS